MSFNYDIKAPLTKDRLSQVEKDANDGQWYKEKADYYDSHSFASSGLFDYSGVSTYKRKKVNYDLFNNVVDIRDFTYVCQPFGAEGGDLPANFTNRDIVSGKIKVLLGMEMKMPFSWKVMAVNEDATTRREQQEFGMIRDYVINEIMRPIRLKNEKAAREQHKGEKLTVQEQQEIEQQVQQETQAQTPDEVKKYMQREHQDPAEVMMQQIMEYLIVAKKVPDKFNRAWKHGLLGGEEVLYVGEIRGEPDIIPVNDLHFDYDRSSDMTTIQEREWAVYKKNMTPSQIIAEYGDELTEDQIDEIYDFSSNRTGIHDAEFTFTEENFDVDTIRVLHINFKAPMKIGFLRYRDKSNKEQLMLVDENYKLSIQQGDIDIEWEWIPEAHEVTKIFAGSKDAIYVRKRPVPGQEKDLDNLFNCNLSYYGAAHDALNSVPTAPMDRMKSYQYFYNILIYRLELLMASDDGKIIGANIKAIPKSMGIDINKWLYFLKANKIAWFNPDEEGNNTGPKEISNMITSMDMSLISDIDKYINLADYIEKKCGASIGVTPQMEAQTGPDESVGNTRQNLIQASHIIQPYFELHNAIKRDALTGLLEIAKVIYSQNKPRKLSYILDDMSYRMITTDPELLDASTYGIFVTNSTKADDAKQAVLQLAQAAMQNDKVTLKEIVKIIRSSSINEAEELLDAAEQDSNDRMQQAEQAKLKQNQDLANREEQLKRDEWEHDKEMVVLKASEDRKTKVQVEEMAAMGYDPNKDEDDDGVPDVVEVAKLGVDAEIKRKKLEQDGEHLQLEQDKFDQQKKMDAHQQNMDKQKIVIDRKKASKPASSKK